MEKVFKRLESKYEAYEKERNKEDGIVDLSLACELADSIPFLIKQAKQTDLYRKDRDYWKERCLLVRG